MGGRVGLCICKFATINHSFEGISPLPQSLYNHFLLLSVAVTILICPKFVPRFRDYGNDLLNLFVREHGKLYGRETYVYNVHCLTHLASDVVRNLGVLDAFSAFPYENCLGKLKKMIRKPQFVIQELSNRLTERQMVGPVEDDISGVPSVSSEHHNGPILPAYRSYN